jgi:sarcosine oxidase subunit beta
VPRSSGPSVVIVGGGALGVCSALELLELGVTEVTVLEKRHVASASSGLAVGIIETQYVDPVSIAVRVYSMGVFARVEREHRVPIVRNGYVRLGSSEADLAAFRSSIEVQHALGVDDARLLDVDGLQRLVPEMDTTGTLCGLYGPSDGYVDPALFTTTVAEMVRARGGTVLTSTELVGYDALPGERHRLRTTGPTLECDYVVNAAGGWATPVGELLGAPAHAIPQRHAFLFARMQRPLPYLMPSVMDYVPGSGRLGLMWRHDSPTSLITGLHSEDLMHDVVDPDRYRRGGDDPAYMAAVGEQLEERLPGVGELTLGGLWAGIYPVSPDGEPAVGPYAARPTVIAALGAGGAGLQSAPGIGRIVAEYVVHGETRTIPAAVGLSPDRPSLAGYRNDAR